jgi:polysaccharide biosynthesis transport protein
MRVGISGPQDVLALLVRRKWWVIVPFLALFSTSALLTYILPRTYVSETLIVVQPRDVPKDFVKDLVSGTPEERLKTIEQMVLSRTNLLKILREFGDTLPEFSKLNLDAKVLKLRDQIDIFFELERGRDGKTMPLSYFRISYQNQNPELAQKIASKLTTLFIEQDSKTRETQVFGTTEFLSAELDKVSTQLAASQEELKVVKSARQFELPDQRDANLRTLDRLIADKKSNSEALDRFAGFRLTLESQLLQTPPTIVKPIPVSSLQGGIRNPQFEELRRQQLDYEEFRKAQAEFDDLSSRYSEKHPDVQAAKVRLERLRQRIPADPTGTDAGSVPLPPTDLVEPNPVYVKMAAQLRDLQTELAIREKEKAYIDREIAKYSSRVENAPNAEQAIADVVRENTELQKNYEDLKNKLAEARLSESLESKQRGAQFSIQDPANYPLTPAKPNKGFVLLACAIASLGIAIVFAGLVDVARQKVWTQSQIEAYWGVPVLVDIPEIVTDVNPAETRKKMFLVAASSVAGAALFSACLYVLYWKQSFVLQHLDPVLQQLVYK